MASIDESLHPSGAASLPAVASSDLSTWGNSAPLALAAFALTTFMLSMVNAGFVNVGVEPVVFGVALMFGGTTQLIAGIIQFRTGNTFGGVLFSTFGAFWLSLFAIAEFFLKDVPAAQVGHALGLFLIAFGIFTVWILAASFRTNLVVVAALADLAATFFVLGAGNYGGGGVITTTVKAGGYLGLIVAFLAAYLSCAEVCEATYGRLVLPVWPLARP
jgi:succinate-acetate transporter protein